MITRDINKIVEQLKAGEVVGLPTETVYGLAGDIENPQAIEKIFTTKERPFFDPLIVHIASKDIAKTHAKWNALAEFLAIEFWPGALTIVAPKLDHIDDKITSGLKSVALRCPSHPLALEVLKHFKGLAAPSANRFGKTSPTKAVHVENEFDDDLLILDGGACDIGIESTVIGIQSESELEIYRPGMITKEQLSKALEKYDRQVLISHVESPVAPGQLKHHYMPDIPLIFNKSRKEHDDVMVLAKLHLETEFNNPVTIELNPNPSITARELYQMFRKGQEAGHDLIIINALENMSSESWIAITNRLEKAASLET
ncbi:MAG: L-threonylcarbamoyladenylate synthase [Thermoproteota archaeon]|jgi:L-threonylcarbamoyladenylate synthase